MRELADTATPSALSLLLWSMRGAGTHYGGPGMWAHRVFSLASPSELAVTLVHTSPLQSNHALFREIVRLPEKPDTAATMMLYLWRSRRWLKENSSRFDLFYGLRAFHETVVPAVCAQRLGLPAIVKPVTYQADLADKGGLSGRLRLHARRREMLKELSAVVAMTRAIARELESYGVEERNIALIPDGIDCNYFYPGLPADRGEMRRRLGWGDLPTVLFCGALVPRKGVLELVEALALAKGRGYECQLVFAGPIDSDEPYTAAVLDKAAELGCHVLMMGFEPDVAPLYRAADIFALPSRQEGLPSSLLEAMASGMPLIVGPFAGVEEIVETGKSGMIVAQSAAEIADALVMYLSDAQIAAAYGAAARETAVRNYTARQSLLAHQHLFARLLAGKDAAE
jgi:glycosyltransferase involved in cell wall biosynthesis